jgi:hypothetical protein
MRLGPTAVSTGFTNNLASTTDNPKIGAYWEDTCTGTNGKVHAKVLGSAPSRKLVVEWQNMQITRGAACAGTGNGTYQVWLFESTGVIQFVYGAIQVGNAVDGGYSVGLQAGGGPEISFASVTTSGATVSYVTAKQRSDDCHSRGDVILLYADRADRADWPVVHLGDADFDDAQLDGLSPDELAYAVYNSADGTNFSFLGSAAANQTNFNATNLDPGVNYFWRVFANSEGALSSAAHWHPGDRGSGNLRLKTGAGGLWSAPGTWSPPGPPTALDNVTIADGTTVTIDVAAVALNVTVGQGTSGILEFEAAAARTLTVTPIRFDCGWRHVPVGRQQVP